MFSALLSKTQVGDHRLSALIIQNRLETIGFQLCYPKQVGDHRFSALLSKTGWRQQVISSYYPKQVGDHRFSSLIIQNRLETIGFQLYYPYDITQQKLFFHNSHTLQRAPFVFVMFSIKYMLHVFFTTIVQALSKTNPLTLTCVYTGISQ